MDGVELVKCTSACLAKESAIITSSILNFSTLNRGKHEGEDIQWAPAWSQSKTMLEERGTFCELEVITFVLLATVLSLHWLLLQVYHFWSVWTTLDQVLLTI